MKREGAVDLNTANEWFKKFSSGCKNLKDQTKSGKSKTTNSENFLCIIETKLMGNIGEYQENSPTRSPV